MRVGFIPLTCSFSHESLIVNWFNIRNGEHNHKIKPVLFKGIINKNNLDPYRDNLLVLYKVNTKENQLDILGYMTLNSDDILTSVPKEKEKIQHQLQLPGFCIPWSLNDADGIECTIDDLCDRVDWILNEVEIDKRWNKEEWDYTTCKLLLRIGLYNPSFHKKQLEKEKEHFMKKIEPYTKDDQSMFQLLRLNINSKQLKNLLVESTLLDRQSYPNELQEPTLWISVHISEVPPEVISNKPLYKGGFMHLHCKDIPYWIWRKITLELHNRVIPIYTQTLPEQLYFVLHHINSGIANSKRPKKKYQQQQNPKKVCSDIEFSPPCIDIIINGKEFPGDENRQHFVSILKKGGITLETVEKLLTNLNDKFPHRSGNIQLKKRWDYQTFYEKGYAPPSCSKIGFCPMNGSTHDKRQIECYKKYKEKYKPTEKEERWQVSHFFGPASWFIWNNKNNKK